MMVWYGYLKYDCDIVNSKEQSSNMGQTDNITEHHDQKQSQFLVVLVLCDFVKYTS